MFILGFSIPVLVLYFKYKKVQTSGKRTAIIILNILLSVFSFFSLIDLLITIIGGSLLNSDYIRQIYESSRGSSYNYSYVNPSDVITTTSSILATVMWALMIINLFILVFGVIVNILGYTAIANKTWTANAIADAQNKRMNAMNYTYYNISLLLRILTVRLRILTVRLKILTVKLRILTVRHRILTVRHRILTVRLPRILMVRRLLKITISLYNNLTAVGSVYAEREMPQGKNTVHSAVRQIRTVLIKSDYKRKIHNHIIKTGYFARFLFSAK